MGTMLQAFNQLQMGLKIALVAVYLLLVVQFRSFALAAVLMLAIPLQGLGSIGALWLRGMAWSPPVLWGMVVLAGVVLSNSILIVDKILNLRQQGIDRHRAIVAASTLRLRPVLMTALAAEDVVVATVPGPYDKAVTKLKRAITGQKLVIVKEVPFQKMLAMVGLKTEQMQSFEIFHPRYGKRLYETNQAAMIEAPLRILVREDGSDVILEYRKPSAVFAPYAGLDDFGQELDQVFANIVANVAE
jgi:uncharacterized protein (DUF302 family)